MKRFAAKFSEWRYIGDEFLEAQGLPAGIRVIAERLRGSRRGRKVRGDRVYRYRPCWWWASDEETVSELIARYLLPAFVFGPVEDGCRIRLLYPNGRVVGGGTLLRTIRA